MSDSNADLQKKLDEVLRNQARMEEQLKAAKELTEAAEERADLAEQARIAAEAAAKGQGVPGKPLTEPVTVKDVKDANVLKLVSKMQAAAPLYADSPGARRQFAVKAQDLVIALRLSDVEFSSRGLSLHRNQGKPGEGDVYVLHLGAHPRGVAELLAQQFSAGHLADLVDDLEKAVQREVA